MGLFDKFKKKDSIDYIAELKEIVNNHEKFTEIASSLKSNDLETKYYSWAKVNGIICEMTYTCSMLMIKSPDKSNFKELYVKSLLVFYLFYEEIVDSMKGDLSEIFIKSIQNDSNGASTDTRTIFPFNDWKNPLINYVDSSVIEEELYESCKTLLWNQELVEKKEHGLRGHITPKDVKEYIDSKYEKNEIDVIKKEEFYDILNYVKSGKNICIAKDEYIHDNFYVSIKDDSMLLLFFDFYC